MFTFVELCIAVKPEVSTVYKVGECLQELTKLWKEYESSQPDKNSESLYNGPTLEVRIPAEHVTATNRQVSLHLISFKSTSEYEHSSFQPSFEIC